MKHGLKVILIMNFWTWSLTLIFNLELDRSYAVKKKLQKKENRKKNDLQVDLTGINDILNTIDVKSKDEFTSQAIHSKKLEQQPKQPAIPSNKIKSKKAKKQAE